MLRGGADGFGGAASGVRGVLGPQLPGFGATVLPLTRIWIAMAFERVCAFRGTVPE